MALTVTKVHDPDRFEIAEPDTAVGVTLFVDQGLHRIFFHTEIAEGFEGRGLAGTLVEGALAATRAEGLRIVAVCPYVRRYLQSHHDHDDIIDPVTQEALDALPQD